jgi:hypothetical protein
MRDGGRCRNGGAQTELLFDHIIRSRWAAAAMAQSNSSWLPDRASVGAFGLVPNGIAGVLMVWDKQIVTLAERGWATTGPTQTAASALQPTVHRVPENAQPRASRIWALQRAAGNHAVSRLLQVQRRPPDVIHDNYQSFYLRGMVPVPRGEVRVQFHQAQGAPSATFAVWYQETGTMQQISFTPTAALRPDLLREDRGVAQFDLDGDGRADVQLISQPNNSTLGLDFVASLPGGGLFRMATVPAGALPRRGIPMGQLPDGRTYYLVPGSTSLPQGPMFVDDRGMAVNPALEAQGAGVLRAAGEGYLLGYALILGLSLAGIALEGLAATEVVAAGTGAAETGAGAALTSGQAGGVIGWGTGQTAAAVAQTEAVTQGLTTQAIRQMIARGLTREWVAAQLAQYEAAVARGGAKLLNQQLLPRLALMRRLLELWPK